MIRLYIGGKEIKLYANTTVTIEYNNNVKNLETIEGDLTYDFDVPVKDNEIIFGHWKERQAKRNESHECLMIINDTVRIRGQLNIKKANEKSYTISIVITPFKEEWKTKKISEIKGEKIEVATSLQTHKQQWNAFLKRCVLQDTGIKFGPIHNEKGYGAQNSDWGFWKGYKGRQLVNPVFLTTPGNEVFAYDDRYQIYLHNETHYLSDNNAEEYTEINQTTLCPQIRLEDVMQICLQDAGYQVRKMSESGIEEFQRIYLQCEKALDATRAQYIQDLAKNSDFTGIPESTEWYGNNITFLRDTIRFNCGNDELQIYTNEKIKFRVEGLYKFNISMILPLYDYNENGWRYTLAVYFSDTTNRTIDEENIIYKKDYVIHGSNTGALIETTFIEEVRANFIGKQMKVIVYGTNNENALWYESQETITGIATILTFDEELSIKLISYETSFALNIYKKEFEVNKQLPDITNQDFIKAIRKDFGLAWFTDYETKSIEMQPLEKVVRAKHIDLTNYNIENEEEIEKTDKEQYIFRYTQEKEEEIDEEKIAARVQTKEQLNERYDPLQYYGKFAFVYKENRWYRSEKVEHETQIWAIEWVVYASTTSKIKVGNGKENELKTTATIPMTKEFLGKYIPQSEFEIKSDLYSDSEDNDLLLLYYRGIEICGREGNRWPKLQYSDMTPFKYEEISLTVESLGEKYIKTMLELIAENETIINKLILTEKSLMEIIRLFKPQDEESGKQTRLVKIGNMIMLPVQFTVELNNNNRRILAEMKSIPIRNNVF